MSFGGEFKALTQIKGHLTWKDLSEDKSTICYEIAQQNKDIEREKCWKL